MKKLISLEEHNATKRSVPKSFPNGIACPNCGEELFDSLPRITLESLPPKLRIHCNSCDYKGYRIQ